MNKLIEAWVRILEGIAYDGDTVGPYTRKELEQIITYLEEQTDIEDRAVTRKERL